MTTAAQPIVCGQCQRAIPPTQTIWYQCFHPFCSKFCADVYTMDCDLSGDEIEET